MFPLAILAGGLATRMRPITEKIPKSLIEVAGEPFIVHQLRLLKSQKIDRIVLCVGYLGEMIQTLIGDGAKYGLHIDYSYDGSVLLGTGGALKKALPLLGEAFFVLYGDSYLDCDYGEVQRNFEASKKLTLMTVFYNDNQWERSNVFFTNNVVISYEKENPTPEMRYIDYGLGIFMSSVFLSYKKDKYFDLADVYKDLVVRCELAGFEVTKRFYEIGSIQGIQELNKYLGDQGY